MSEKLGIGVDDFRRVREENYYYIDKTLMIKDFLDYSNVVSLITRPRRFGKTLNMTMLREFFDIEKDSQAIFSGLHIMETKYANQMNTHPVIFLTLKNCSGTTIEGMLISLAKTIRLQYEHFSNIFASNGINPENDFLPFYQTHKFFTTLEDYEKDTPVIFEGNQLKISILKNSLVELIKTVSVFYNQKVLVIIDEYDQPLIKAHEMEYRLEFSKGVYGSFLGSALKGNDYLHQAILTGIQRVAKESIFSEVNNFMVYTVTSKKYASYFGLTGRETTQILEDYGHSLTTDIKNYYDGYTFDDVDIYNPWSILSYADEKELKPYWLNTSTNSLIRELILSAKQSFNYDFEELITYGTVEVTANMEASFLELATTSTLWGLLINSGYLTVVEKIGMNQYEVSIPNEEVKTEFRTIVELYTKTEADQLTPLFEALFTRNMRRFLKLYRKLIMYHVSYNDATSDAINQLSENSFHMLFLGMSMATLDLYKVESNREMGDGRSDIMMKSLQPSVRPHILIEFKHEENLKKGASAALSQIFDNRYYAELTGNVLCIGIAHYKKKCEMVHEEIVVNEFGEIKRDNKAKKGGLNE